MGMKDAHQVDIAERLKRHRDLGQFNRNSYMLKCFAQHDAFAMCQYHFATYSPAVDF
jgi:hypothetical protein